MRLHRSSPKVPVLVASVIAAGTLLALASEAHCEPLKKPSIGRTLLLNSIGPALDETATRWAERPQTLPDGRVVMGVEGVPWMKVGPTGRAAIHLFAAGAVTALDLRWQREGRRREARILRASKFLYHCAALGVAIHHGKKARSIR